MAKLILHLGMHRTGSTAIQSSLATNNGDGFVYPLIGERPFKPYHEDSLDQVFSRERFEANTSFVIPVPPSRSIREKTKVPMNEDRLKELATDGREKIKYAATEAGNGTVILSGEGAYRYLSIKDLFALKAFAEELFDEVKVVAYVRGPFELMSSAFHNQVMGHRFSDFQFTFTRYDRLQKFDQVFGRDNVHLFKYDRSSFPDGDIVRHFCETVGLQRLTSVEANVTSSRPAVSAVYRLNRIKIGEGQAREHKMIVNLIRQSFPHQQWPKFRLSPQLMRPIIEAQARHLDWIEERIGCSLRAQPEEQENDIRQEMDLLLVEPQARMQLLKLGETVGKDASQLLQRALAA